MVEIIVLVKQMPDLELVKPNPSTGEPMIENVQLKLDNLSENAVEEAVRLKEKHGGKITALLFGNEQSGAIMKRAYAMGVDEGFIITGYKGNNPRLTAKVLAAKIKSLKYDMVILGNQSADSVSGLLPGCISRALEIPLLGNANSLEVEGDTVKVLRALEENNAHIEGKLPLVVSVTQEINEPRIPPVMQIMSAGRKPLNTEAASISEETSVKVLSNKVPKSERKNIVIEDVEKGIPEIVKVIKEESR